MVISYRWLMDYFPEKVPVALLDTILTSIGLEVEAIEPIQAVKGGLEGLCVGEVLTCEKHPDADKLKLTTVRVSEHEVLPIVCGAPNVAAGQKVIVALEGTLLYPKKGEPFTIKKAKIRGAESRGMICAEDEIGMGESHDGIMILPAETPVGMPAAAYFQLPEADYAIHIGLTPNRADANSHIGVAREVMAWLQYHKKSAAQVQWPAQNVSIPQEKCPIAIDVQEDACPRYMAALLEKVQVKPSPSWMQDRLIAIGLRPINNVVDITNYVLHEMGNPLHAFDADAIDGNQIVVKKATAGESFTTLDGKLIQLQAQDLMICDAQKPLCMAGVMGGQNSGVKEGTTRVFLEVAWFDAGTIRKTSMHHNLRSDAATHFEKGISAAQVPIALKRAIGLLVEHAGATLAGGITDIYPKEKTAQTITVTYDYVRQLSGHPFEDAAIKSILKPLGFDWISSDEKSFTIAVPDFKTDIEGPADIVEEIIRLHGLDNIAIPEKLNIELTSKDTNLDAELQEKVAAYLVGQGCQEIVTNSIVNATHYKDRTDVVQMINSLSAELNALRPDMLLSGLEVVAYNLNRKNNNLRLFEWGHTYAQIQPTLYAQRQWLCLWITGAVQPAAWNQQEIKADSAYAKGLCAALGKLCGVSNLTFEVQESGAVVGRQGGQDLLYWRPVDEAAKQLMGVKATVWYVAIQWDAWVAKSRVGAIRYAEVPKHPAVERDVAIVVDSGLPYAAVEKVTKQLKLQPLKQFGLFDVFENEKLGAGKKSMALNFVFQLEDRTLTDAETEALMQQLITTYREKLHAQIRE